MTEMRYLLHVTEADRWPAVLSNLGNLTQLGLAGQVTVLINGTAIYAIQGRNDWTAAMERAANAGATFEVCERSLVNHQFDQESLPTWITQIWAAVPVIAEHMADGYAYVKP